MAADKPVEGADAVLAFECGSMCVKMFSVTVAMAVAGTDLRAEPDVTSGIGLRNNAMIISLKEIQQVFLHAGLWLVAILSV